MSYTRTSFSGDPKKSEDVLGYLLQELESLERQLAETVALDLRPVHAAPNRPREGMIVFADGTDWNPGAGKGVYTYSGGAWVQL